MAKKKLSKQAEFLQTVTAENFEAYYFDNGSIVWNEPYRFPDEERTFRPQCINHGCYNPVAVFSGILGLAKGREIRTVCSPCHLASYGKKPLKEGVTAHKKTYCENRDGHLGFACTSTIHGSWVLELDHKDGNHLHNLPGNVETLCKICHAQKSRLAGDYKKASKQHTSPNSSLSNTFQQVDDSLLDSKTDPNLQSANLCIGESGQLQIQDSLGILPTSLFEIS